MAKRRNKKGAGPKASDANLIPLGNSRWMSEANLESSVRARPAPRSPFEGSRPELIREREAHRPCFVYPAEGFQDDDGLHRERSRACRTRPQGLSQAHLHDLEYLPIRGRGHGFDYDRSQGDSHDPRTLPTTQRKNRKKRIMNGKIHKEPSSNGTSYKATASNLIPLGRPDRLNSRGQDFDQELDLKTDVPSSGHTGYPGSYAVPSQSGQVYVSLMKHSDLNPASFRPHENNYNQFMDFDISRLRAEAELSNMPIRFLDTGTKEDIARWISCLRDVHALSDQARMHLLQHDFAPWATQWGQTKLEQDSFLATTYWAMGVCRRVGVSGKTGEEVLAMAKSLGIQLTHDQSVFEAVWVMKMRGITKETGRVEWQNGNGD